MDFLIIVSGLLILNITQNLSMIQHDGWYLKLSSWLSEAFGRNVWVYLATLLLPVIGLMLLEAVVSSKMFGLTGYFLGLFVLLYAFGRGDLDADVELYKHDLARQDLQAAYHDTVPFNTAHHESKAVDWPQLHEEALANIGYRYFEHYFVVLFWFILAGPAGALLYRLAQLHCDDEMDRGRIAAAARRFLWLMEWVPVRILGFTLAIVGNFASCLKPLLESLVDFSASSALTISRLVSGALDIEYTDGDQTDAENTAVLEVSGVQSLFHRAMIAVVCMVGLFVIFT